MRYLHEEAAAFAKLEWLVLANDSMFWPTATQSHVKEILDEGADWACLTESFVGKYHAQSYFLGLSGPVVFSDACRAFCKNYWPFSQRRHVIRRGEIGLSQELKKKFGKPFCLFSGGRLVRRFLQGLDAEIAEVLIGELADSLADRDNEDSKFERPMSSLTSNEIARRIGSLALDSNPTHALCQSLNHLFVAPLKRDISFRITLPIGFVPWSLKGFSPDEKKQIEVDLRERGLRDDLSLSKRLLMHTGRL
jgi:hypothetical protein